MALPLPAPDRTALVTGASSGIGVEIARELARRGQNVTLVARSEAKLQDLAAELSATGVRADVLPADLSDRASRAELPDRVAANGSVVSILVNNAGLSTMGPVARSDPDAEINMVEVDVVAIVDLCSRFLGGMVERGSGAVLNVASTAAFQPLPGQAGYGAGKAFVLSYTRSIGGELRGTGVTATTLCPGPVRTGFGEAAGISQEDAEASLPAFMWETAEAVARTGVDAMAAGRPVAIPGPANRVAAALVGLVPKQLLVPVLAGRHPGLKD
ncbi:SDR family NAD(P)-dependent oxidoreductase [Dermatobacter hominis]|uniref:SDR family NAD(P)-dependent oxidoreductase n=1 Tax=Dermatobacter hominis TaxID=2884263 RepID=UPI001D10B89F|nr:SDR family oxidoreductase [Dermatobacter hominis]UDY37034.1 SDR family oxidoreductase [Dermatobacter hominis]